MRICWSLEIWLQISSQADNVKLRIKDGVYKRREGREEYIEGMRDILQEGCRWMMASRCWTLKYAVAEIEILLDR